MTGPPTRRRPLPLPGDSGPSETLTGAWSSRHNTPAAGGVQGNPRLLSYWLATRSLSREQRRQLEELGVTKEAIHRGGGLGWDRITTIGRLFSPSPGGEVAAVQPVRPAAGAAACHQHPDQTNE